MVLFEDSVCVVSNPYKAVLDEIREYFSKLPEKVWYKPTEHVSVDGDRQRIAIAYGDSGEGINRKKYHLCLERKDGQLSWVMQTRIGTLIPKLEELTTEEVARILRQGNGNPELIKTTFNNWKSNQTF